MIKETEHIELLLEEMNSILQNCSTIPLQELNGESHMSRFDNKYIFCSSILPDILTACNDHYNVLDVDGNRLLNYQSDYYDLPSFGMYLDHHNGKRNRYKIRFREYLESGDKYLEIKHKNNKGITTKKRIATENLDISSDKSNEFIQELTPYTSEILIESLKTKYRRLTLINKHVEKRITIDCALEFTYRDQSLSLPGIAIAEIKNLDRNPTSRFNRILDSYGVKKSGFSKYAVGMALLNNQLKKNRFKEKLIKIQNFQNEFTNHYTTEHA
ncbi:polyphosphate polymerase domain-containing protein [Sunxiuqinia sp. A32]|uniref:polyphosphate polymerase domain-containing protein n=1 Tax=Sunxiuqinia sp. A32 TaxID=3461496 RepID=UPI004045EFBA